MPASMHHLPRRLALLDQRQARRRPRQHPPHGAGLLRRGAEGVVPLPRRRPGEAQVRPGHRPLPQQRRVLGEPHRRREGDVAGPHAAQHHHPRPQGRRVGRLREADLPGDAGQRHLQPRREHRARRHGPAQSARHRSRRRVEAAREAAARREGRADQAGVRAPPAAARPEQAAGLAAAGRHRQVPRSSRR